MKRALTAVLIFFLLLLASCQKEIDFATGSSGNSGNLLVKIVQKTGSDSTVTNYTYDAASRLTGEKITGLSAGISVDNDLKIVRNTSGVITQTIQKSPTFIAAGIDSIITRYNYTATTSRYNSAVFDISLSGFTASDSAAFSYDATGKIIKEEHYQAIALIQPYELSFKIEYTYSAGGNVGSVNQFSYDAATSAFTLVTTINYTYDAKTNPLKLNMEGIVITRPAFFGANNATKTEYIDPTDPANNFTDNLVYVYNTGNRPKTAVSTETPSGAISNITWYYQ